MAQARAGPTARPRRSTRTGSRSKAASSSRGAKAPPVKDPDGEKSAGAPLCSVGFCPICLAVTALGEARPDLVEHVLLAGREMLLAVRALVDARLEGAGQPARLERLTIE